MKNWQNCFCIAFGTVAALGGAAPRAWGHCVYNESSAAMVVRVHGTEFNTTISPGDFACCPWDDGGCNPDPNDRFRLLTLEVRTADGDIADYMAVVSMQAGGYAVISNEDRSAFGLAPGYWVRTYDVNNATRDTSPWGVGLATRNVRFLVAGDCQFVADAQGAAENAEAELVNQHMTARILGDPSIRGIAYTGDLTHFARTDEFNAYKATFAGFFRYVFDGLGNHDYHTSVSGEGCCTVHPDLDCCTHPGRIRVHVRDNRHVTRKTRKGDPHYSWDWHDVHLVQLNVFPGNETAPGHDAENPYNSLDFLIADLAEHVGASGRPIVLFHHYGFDDFSIGAGTFCGLDNTEPWWTANQRLAYWNALAPYNVVAIFTGHLHMAPDPQFCDWRVDWVRPAGAAGGPEFIPSFISAASRNGSYLEVRIDAANQVVVERRDRLNVRDTECVFEGGALFVNRAAPPPGTGSPRFPFSTVTQAIQVLPVLNPFCTADPTVRISGGTYPEELTVDRMVRLESNGGLVTIGP